MRQSQRIGLRQQVSAVRPDLHQARHRGLFRAGAATRARVGRGLYRSSTGLLGSRGDFRLHRTVRTLAATRGRSKTLKVSTPTLFHARRVAKILLVEGVEEIGVTAVERCGFKHAKQANSEALV